VSCMKSNAFQPLEARDEPIIPSHPASGCSKYTASPIRQVSLLRKRGTASPCRVVARYGSSIRVLVHPDHHRSRIAQTVTA
jgi:hypothetical protein